MAIMNGAPAWRAAGGSLLGGGLIGVLAKLADESALANQLGLNDLGTYLGLWVVLVAAIAAWSPSRRQAALRVALFLLAMVAAYYAVTWLLFGVLPVGLVLAWAAIALLGAPVFAVLAWPARQTGWAAALGAALPVGLLVWEAYSLRLQLPRYLVQFVFDLAAAVALVVVLPQDGEQRLRALLLTLPVAIAANVGFTQILPRVLGLLG
jgi:hypothetical protein